MLRKLAVIAFSSLFLGQVAMAATYIAVDEPELQDAVVMAVDLYGSGDVNLLVGQESRVFLYDGNQKTQLLSDITDEVSALAAGDVTGDFRNDLVVGTANGGALNFYSQRDGVWQRQNQSEYLWDTIAHLEIHDINDDGWGDVLALTEKGQLHILLSSEGTLVPFWKSPADQVVVGAEVIDLNHNGRPEIIYAFRSGYVGVLTWRDQQFFTLWENYPWGLVDSLVIVPHDNSPEWLVVTNQKMVYSWRWHNQEVISRKSFEANELGEQVFYYPEQGLLSLSQTKGISLFELQSNSVEEKWRVPNVKGNYAFFHAGNFYFRDGTNAFYRLIQGSDAWRVFIHDQEVTHLVEFFYRDGELYFNLGQLANLLGLQYLFENGWYFEKDGHEIVLYPNSSLADYDDLTLPMNNVVVEADGHPYITAHDFSLFGWKLDTDSARQHLIFLKDWGWWF